MSKEDKISDILNIRPTQQQLPVKNEVNKSDVEDIETALQHQKDVISLGIDSMEELIMLAKSSESIEGFTSVAGFVRALTTANKEMIAMIDAKNKMSGVTVEQPSTVINNNIVANPADFFNNMVKEVKKKD
mgnify:CR=1 FL=1